MTIRTEKGQGLARSGYRSGQTRVAARSVDSRSGN